MPLIIAAFLCAGCDRTAVNGAGSPSSNSYTRLLVQSPDCTRSQGLQVELADTDEARRTGLMNRQTLGTRRGMLFLWSHSRYYSMWMKNTLIPLDMLFIDERGMIRQIERNTQPLSLDTVVATQPVTAILEIGGGVAARLNIRVGDYLAHNHFGTTGRCAP